MQKTSTTTTKTPGKIMEKYLFQHLESQLASSNEALGPPKRNYPLSDRLLAQDCISCGIAVLRTTTKRKQMNLSETSQSHI